VPSTLRSSAAAELDTLDRELDAALR
jgi:hypothetical protein